MMSGIRSKNTKPELIIRSLLHKNGFRFRLHRKDLPGKPDLVLPRYNTAIFVNGCFWHGHNNCRLFRLPKSRTEFWKSKIGRNIDRDVEKQTALLESGWSVFVIWECATKGSSRLDEAELLEKITGLVNEPSCKVEHISGHSSDD